MDSLEIVPKGEKWLLEKLYMVLTFLKKLTQIVKLSFWFTGKYWTMIKTFSCSGWFKIKFRKKLHPIHCY